MQQYRYLIEIHQGERELIDQVPVSVDFSAALEWTWLAGIQRGDLELSDGTRSSAVVPVWHPELGSPYIAGFRATILAERAAGITEQFNNNYFSDEVNAATRRLLEEGRLSTRDDVRFLALAFFDEAHAEAQAGPTPPFSMREAPPELTLGQLRLADFTADSTRVPVSTEEADGEGVPIVIPRRVLDETRDATVRSRDRETGGILIGHLHRDAERSELFVEVTAQIPVVHAPAEVNRLTFTPETWTAVQAAVDLRRSKEILLGSWHSHPVLEWCKDCPQEKKDVCPLAKGFMSADDCQLHRTVFPRAYTCSLVVSNIAEDRDVVQSLFGWHRGLIKQRGYYVVDNNRRSASDNVKVISPERKTTTKPSGG
jgi:proteasome lid subunit RPN8/RPN11